MTHNTSLVQQSRRKSTETRRISASPRVRTLIDKDPAWQNGADAEVGLIGFNVIAKGDCLMRRNSMFGNEVAPNHQQTTAFWNPQYTTDRFDDLEFGIADLLF
jgi:hypothetical protein